MSYCTCRDGTFKAQRDLGWSPDRTRRQAALRSTRARGSGSAPMWSMTRPSVTGTTPACIVFCHTAAIHCTAVVLSDAAAYHALTQSTMLEHKPTAAHAMWLACSYPTGHAFLARSGRRLCSAAVMSMPCRSVLCATQPAATTRGRSLMPSVSITFYLAQAMSYCTVH